ncbi:Hpt domain-containing protein [Microlunatus sp. Gsoil 973]|jgi:hypothetical protein|uniref:Hpt domain-containing protein n=1 Tax=Microlunatus sp. Gsoil 973 TaxID=2672569 RepID=UPI0012B46ECE|nr:Hpt domain-containing protein [Microlunatus sp. Gsoil 973]QGN35113.1 hypothetical protein GJV80_22365 [Microlunatus sp. Gsoil 973]
MSEKNDTNAGRPSADGQSRSGGDPTTDISSGTSSGTSPDAAEALHRVADIADRARERNIGRAGDLAAWASIGRAGRISAEQRGEAAEIAHQLAGSAGTFGYQAATDVAREVERLFGEADGAEAWTRLTECVRDLVRRLQEPPELTALE